MYDTFFWHHAYSKQKNVYFSQIMMMFWRFFSDVFFFVKFTSIRFYWFIFLNFYTWLFDTYCIWSMQERSDMKDMIETFRNLHHYSCFYSWYRLISIRFVYVKLISNGNLIVIQIFVLYLNKIYVTDRYWFWRNTMNYSWGNEKTSCIQHKHILPIWIYNFKVTFEHLLEKCMWNDVLICDHTGQAATKKKLFL